MGSGIAEVCARSGVDVTVVEADDAGVARAEAAIGRSLDRAVKAGKLDPADREAATTGSPTPSRWPTWRAPTPRSRPWSRTSN